MIKAYLFKNDCLKKEVFLKKEILKHIEKYKENEEKYKCSFSAYALLSFLNIDVLFDEDDIPYAKDIYFSISHTSNYVLVVISKQEIGCDIEKIREIKPSLIDKVFLNINEENKAKICLNPSLFFERWCKVEAYTKRIKKGLTSYPKDIKIEGNFIKKIIDDLYLAISIENKESVCFISDQEISNIFNNIKDMNFNSRELKEENLSLADKAMLLEAKYEKEFD